MLFYKAYCIMSQFSIHTTTRNNLQRFVTLFKSCSDQCERDLAIEVFVWLNCMLATHVTQSRTLPQNSVKKVKENQKKKFRQLTTWHAYRLLCITVYIVTVTCFSATNYTSMLQVMITVWQSSVHPMSDQI